MDGNIFNSQGVHVALVRGSTIFSLSGQKLYDLRASTYTNCLLIGHLANESVSDKHLDKAMDELFLAS
jgi:hypothetical protein